LLGVACFLAKPYTSDKLLGAVHQLLNGSSDAAPLRLVV